MNDKTREILNKSLKRLDLVTIGVLLVLLGTVGYLVLAEQGYTTTETEPPAPRPWVYKLPVPGKTPEAESLKAYQRVEANILKVDGNINNDNDARRIIQNNMFDLKTIQENTQLAEQLKKQYDEAEKLFAEKKFAESLVIVNDILSKDPRRREAEDLKRRLETAMKPAGAP